MTFCTGRGIEELIRSGNVNIRDARGRTPLFLAVEKGTLHLMRSKPFAGNQNFVFFQQLLLIEKL